jgi:hypothetical protein
MSPSYPCATFRLRVDLRVPFRKARDDTSRPAANLKITRVVLDFIAERAQPATQLVVIHVFREFLGVIHTLRWRAFHRPSTASRVALKTVQWVCKCGSRSPRLVSWRNVAATMFPVERDPCWPDFHTRVSANFSSSVIASRTARSCASRIRLSSQSATIETLFGGLIVKSWKIRRFAVSFPFSQRIVFNLCGNRAPVSGFRPSHNARKSFSDTAPDNPSFFAPSPIHSPVTF